MYHYYIHMLKKPNITAIPQAISHQGLSLERLYAFCRVVQAGGFTTAAVGKASNQALMSRQVSQLEEFFGGVHLMRRPRRGAELTELGDELYKLAVAYIAAIEDFRRKCCDQPPAITIGAGGGIIQWWILPKLALTKKALPPKTKLSLMNLRSNEIIERVTRHEIEFGVVRSSAATDAGLASHVLGNLEYALFIARRALPANPKSTKLDAKALMSKFPLALIQGEGVFRKNLETAAKNAGCELRVETEFSSSVEVARAVRAADTAAVLPVLAKHDLPDSDYLMVPLPWAKSIARQMCLIWSPKLAKTRADVMSVAIPALKRTWHMDRSD